MSDNESILHIKKLCVGPKSLEAYLERLQDYAQADADFAVSAVIKHTTRHKPKNSAELCQSGYLYWIIAGHFTCRHKILALQDTTQDERPACTIVMDARPELVLAYPHRPFQGWRYLKATDAPALCDSSQDNDAPDASLPKHLREQLDSLGLL